MGVSRTLMREALGKLEEEGVVQIRPQYGTFVTPILVEGVNSSQFIREAVDCAAVREATRHCTASEREELRRFLKN